MLADAVTRLWPEALYDAGRKDHSEKYQYDFRFPRAFTAEDWPTPRPIKVRIGVHPGEAVLRDGPLGEDARKRVGRPTRGERHDNGDRA